MYYLTIAIPTYNRPVQIIKQLSTLAPQLRDDVEIIVLDNHSDESVFDLVAANPILQERKNIRYYRNAANIGAAANILRCFEYANGQWVWVLGDDDEVEGDALELICNECEKSKEFVYINFASTLLSLHNIKRFQSTITTGADEFIEGIDSFANLLFLSAGVYKTKTIKKYLRIGYQEVDSYGCHTAMLIEAIHHEENPKVLFSNLNTVQWQEAPAGQRWESSLVNYGLQRLIYLMPLLKSRRIFASKLQAAHPAPKFPRKLKELIKLYGAEDQQATELFALHSQLNLALNETSKIVRLLTMQLFFGVVLKKFFISLVNIYFGDKKFELVVKPDLKSKFSQSKRL